MRSACQMATAPSTAVLTVKWLPCERLYAFIWPRYNMREVLVGRPYV